MRKIYLLAIIFFLGHFAKAQTVCDTINMPIPSNWTIHSYTDTNTVFGLILGYVSGVNAEGYTQQANYFDLSTTSYSYMLGTIIKFTKANSNKDTNLPKSLYVRVYADNNGTPGTEITTDQTRGQITLNQIKDDVAANRNTNINFPSPIALPTSKKFYVAVDMSNFVWSDADYTRDSICIGATGDNETANTAWNYDGDAAKWKSYTKVWDAPPNFDQSLDVTLYIFPYVSTAATGCGLLPVKLLSFNAERKNNDVVVNWQVSNEMNMKGYEVEKANNNNIYKTVAFVSAFNNLKNQNYSITDKNAFTNSSTVQYRLKQIDGDGSVQYSKIITIKSNGSYVVFQNPFTGVLKLQLSLSSPQTVSANMYDIQGRLVATQKPVLYNAPTNTIALNSTANLKAGTYILQLVVGNEQLTYKVMKQ